MFNRQPSQRFQEVLALHAEAHVNGLIRRYEDDSTTTHPGEKIFEGSELYQVVDELQVVANTTRAKHLLDFGCGKARGYFEALKVNGQVYSTLHDALGIDPACTYLYDPGLPEFSQPPRKDQTFDLVVCTDVLEHIPEEDTDMVLDYLFEKCNKGLFLSIACDKALAILANGENAHVNVKSPDWWIEKLETRRKKKPVHLFTSLSFKDTDGRLKTRFLKSV